jgi:transcriptional regulator with XRE-family HTH domain
MIQFKDKSNLNAMTDSAIIAGIGNSLKSIRLQKNISQQELSEISGLNRTTISRMEREGNATLANVVRVLRALNSLEVVNAFHVAPDISPMQMLRSKKRERKYASSKRSSSNKTSVKSTW